MTPIQQTSRATRATVSLSAQMVFCAATIAAICSPAMSQVPAAKFDPAPAKAEVVALSLEQQIAALVAQPAVARAHWGVIVTTLDGKPIYALNEGQLFQPASNTKLFTTAAAMALLPATHVFTTTVTGGGLYMEDGTLRGNLSLNGVGDPNFSAQDLPYIAPSLRQKPMPPTDDPLRSLRKLAPPVRHPLHDLEEMADQVRASGVKRVEGDIYGNSIFPWQPYPADWSVDDLVWGYAAPVSGLTVADNVLKITISSARTSVDSANPELGTLEMESSDTNSPYYFSAVAEIAQAIPYYTVQMYAVSSSNKKPTSIHISRAPGSHVVQVDGYIAFGATPVVEEIAVDDPEEYAAMAFKQMLIDRGIAVTGSGKTSQHFYTPMPQGTTEDFAKESAEPIPNLAPIAESPEFPPKGRFGCGDCDKRWAVRTLATHVSAPLRDDVVVTNKESLNLHAELMLHQLGLAITGNGNTAQGIRVIRQFLLNAGINKDDFIFFDGSGLSGHNLVAPRAIAKLLTFAALDPKTGAPQPWFAAWRSSLPVGGEDGTLASRFAKPPLKDHIFAKTGTLGEARALSGYLDCASGRTVIFSILVGNHLPGTSSDRDVMDKIIAAIAAAE